MKRYDFPLGPDGGMSEYPEFLRSCKGVQEFAEQWRKVPKEKALDVFLSTVHNENFSSDNLLFLYRALELVHGPEVIQAIREKWPQITTVVNEIELGKTN